MNDLEPCYVGNGMVSGRDDVNQQCDYCGKRFALLHDLVMHEVRKHE